MSYQISLSRKTALARSREIFKDALAVQVLYQNRALTSSVQQMMFQAAVIMACASLEQYIVSFFDDWLLKLQQNKAKFKHIPPSMKTYFLMKKHRHNMQNLIAVGDEMKFIRETDITQEYYAVLDGRRLIKGIASFRDFKFYDGSSFPTENNIKKIFSILGMPRIFEELRDRSNRSFVYLLRSFLDVRNAIAHRQSPDLTIDDMKNYLGTVRALILYLDKVLYWHLTNVSEVAFWPKA